MAAFRGSLSRSVLATARSFCSSHRSFPPSLSAPRIHQSRIHRGNGAPFSLYGASLGGSPRKVHSLLPLLRNGMEDGVVGFRHISHPLNSLVSRAFCRTCQDR